VIENVKLARVALVVIKLRIDGENHLLMRRDLHWQDVNFIGGHEEPEDRSKLENTARRELLEEVPLFRTINTFRLAPLTDEFEHGPVFSRSAQCPVKYTLRFFLLEFTEQPGHTLLNKVLSDETLNLLISSSDLSENRYHMTSLIAVLDLALNQGFNNIPLSWPYDIRNCYLMADR
jgi:8-oxo-dGTP pyrophosphatase MutT (NUDIX family)